MSERRVVFDTVPAEARAFQGDTAGLITRGLANAIDLAVLMLLLAAAYFAVAGFLFLRQGARFSFPIVSSQVAFAGWFCAMIAYFSVSWATGGRTYGDRLLGLRVVTNDRGGLSGWRSSIRALLCVIAPLLLIWAAVDRRNRSVQDVIVRTTVVYDWGGARAPRDSNDTVDVAVDVAATVPHEPHDRDPEPLPRVDGER